MTEATWAGRSATPPTPDQNGERAGWLPIAGAIVALGLVGAGGYVLGNSDGSTTTEAARPPTSIEVSATPEAAPDPTTTTAPTPVTTEASTTTTAVPIEDDASTTSTEAAPAVAVPEEEVAEPDPEPANQVIVGEGEVRGAVLRGGVLYLGGAVPSREVADQIIERAAAVVGEDNIVDEYVVDPNAILVPGAPLYIDDVVLFAYGIATYDPQFEPLLDLGLALLTQNPSVTVTIITHTDASGSEIGNDLLSLRRGQSVAQYWVDRGVPLEQIVIDARGERDPRADNNTDQGAQLNRRAEFYIEGLLP